ncbi:uncharacterized protein BO97DRAFT_117153 [Aspergillus homomorphus CBS 101889]|uniref:Uncharacterized protein n=1 Tax=Aspergillus homomorphus (strain CBS 101889) TaxID=1450537 RepID=A0A395HV13_ASPHC|nr:hypothetical protein BO97DRAFT_117153 [Aspergillus homomorphus CBS 101889]RAL10678.1 hypothetical protein BO97DRAFT_117153 [Aspergillus homomorphus CBS 101889]
MCIGPGLLMAVCSLLVSGLLVRGPAKPEQEVKIMPISRVAVSGRCDGSCSRAVVVDLAARLAPAIPDRGSSAALDLRLKRQPLAMRSGWCSVRIAAR